METDTPEQAVIQAVTPEMFNAYAEWESPDLPDFPVKHAAFLGWVRTAFMAGFRSARLAQSQPASEGLREALEKIADLGSDGEHSGDRHARCRDIARAALQPLTEPQRLGQEGEDEKYRLMLLDLLAVIHRDGGHKTQAIGIKPSFEQAIKISSERTLSTPAQAEPVAFISAGQLEAITDRDDDGGTYLPVRKAARGNFTTPLYAHPPAPPQDREAVVEALRKCRDQFAFYAAEHKAKAEAAHQEWDDACYWGNVAEQGAKQAEYLKRAKQYETNQEFVVMCDAALPLLGAEEREES